MSSRVPDEAGPHHRQQSSGCRDRASSEKQRPDAQYIATSHLASETGPAAGLGGETPKRPPEVGHHCAITTSLIWCPEVPERTHYTLYRRYDERTRDKLDSGTLNSHTPSLNLAWLRHKGATLGANEVVLILPHGCDATDGT